MFTTSHVLRQARSLRSKLQRARRARARRARLRHGLLAALSAAVALAACEVALRLFHPRYELAASPLVDRANRANTYRILFHPDTGTAHRVVHNNLGGRQSRNFPAASLDGTVNIAFFGDSQTENLHLPAQYSYTEPLDFLLNVSAHAGDKDNSSALAQSSAPRFQVLNFGAWGNGTAHSYLRWRALPVRRKLHHVFYMAVGNDFLELRLAIDAGMLRVGESGELPEPFEGGPPQTPAWKRLLARLHLTYLALDAWQRFDIPPRSWRTGNRGDDPRPTIAKIQRHKVLRTMRELLRHWQAEVEADGGVFHVVLTPERRPWFDAIWQDGALSRGARGAREAPALDLRECFRASVPDFRWGDWQFANDPHWTSAANMVAATCLYRHLERVLGLPTRTDGELAHARHAYYRAFMDTPAWEGERYMPTAAWARPRPGAAWPASAGAAIVAKYLALELAPASAPRWLRDAYEAGALATSVWDVYANIQERRLAYVKSPCAADWRARGPRGGFFLHAVPFTPERVPADAGGLGFVSLDGAPLWYLRRSADECVFSVRLPDYPLARVRTGQYTQRGEGADAVYSNIWSVEFPMPLARSAWHVYAGAQGRSLDYVKERCRPADTQARFFLHVHPLRSADPPGRGAANLDFEWGRNGGAMADGTCRVSAKLPDFAIDFVRTGQFRDGVVPRRLWSARIDFAEVERARRRTTMPLD